MTKVMIETTGLSMAVKLADLITRRMLPVTAETGLADNAEPSRGATLVFSRAFESQIGGQQALIERARKFLPRLMLVIAEGEAKYSVTPELGGKILRVQLPAGKDDALQSALMVADLICAELSNMIAADDTTVAL